MPPRAHRAPSTRAAAATAAPPSPTPTTTRPRREGGRDPSASRSRSCGGGSGWAALSPPQRSVSLLRSLDLVRRLVRWLLSHLNLYLKQHSASPPSPPPATATGPSSASASSSAAVAARSHRRAAADGGWTRLPTTLDALDASAAPPREPPTTRDAPRRDRAGDLDALLRHALHEGLLTALHAHERVAAAAASPKASKSAAAAAAAVGCGTRAQSALGPLAAADGWRTGRRRALQRGSRGGRRRWWRRLCAAFSPPDSAAAWGAASPTEFALRSAFDSAGAYAMYDASPDGGVVSAAALGWLTTDAGLATVALPTSGSSRHFVTSLYEATAASTPATRGCCARRRARRAVRARRRPICRGWCSFQASGGRRARIVRRRWHRCAAGWKRRGGWRASAVARMRQRRA